MVNSHPIARSLMVNIHSIALFLIVNSHPIALFLMVNFHPSALFFVVNSHPIAFYHNALHLTRLHYATYEGCHTVEPFLMQHVKVCQSRRLIMTS